MWNRRELLQRSAALSGLASLGLGRPAWAQLNGNAVIVSGFPAGGMGDNVARPVAERLRGRYATSLMVEARTGAGGRIAVEYVKRAAPDGLTILQIPSSPMTLYPHTYKKLNYDPLTDFAPVCSTVTYAFSFTAGPGPAGRDQDGGRLRRLGPRQSQAGDLRHPGRGLGPALRRHAAAEGGRHRDDQRRLSRRRAAAERPARRPGAGELQRGRRGDAARALGQAALAGHHQRTAFALPAGGADLDRAGLQEHRGAGVARLVPAGQDAGRRGAAA